MLTPNLEMVCCELVALIELEHSGQAETKTVHGPAGSAAQLQACHDPG